MNIYIYIFLIIYSTLAAALLAFEKEGMGRKIAQNTTKTSITRSMRMLGYRQKTLLLYITRNCSYVFCANDRTFTFNI